ncbi:MAG: thermonuclease family protein [Pyrinomonadaceae bacterium]
MQLRTSIFILLALSALACMPGELSGTGPYVSASPAGALLTSEAATGKVVGITDGDTIKLLTEGKQITVRLAGIDAPERTQAFGNKAKQKLSDMIFGKIVAVRSSKIDKYGRTIGQIFEGETDVNLEMVKAGLAWHYKRYEREQSPADRGLYSKAETAARAERLGLWSTPAPQAPWEFRHPKDIAESQPASTAAPFISSSVAPADDQRIKGNKNSRIYHRPGCPSYGDTSPSNVIWLETAVAAEAAGYRKARNC